MSLGAIIMAGGASRRMGRDKALIEWDGRTAVERCADLVRACGARSLLVSGADLGLPFVPDPPGSGPVGGLIAAAAKLSDEGEDRLLVLAVDAPSIEAEDLEPLLASPPPGAHFSGLPLPMVIEVSALPKGAANDWPLRRLAEAAGLAVLPPPPGAEPRLRGANTPSELRALRS